MNYKTYQDLKRVVSDESKAYKKYAFRTSKEFLFAKLLGHSIFYILKWQEYSRKLDYYSQKCGESYNLIFAFLSKYYAWRKNKYARICGFEISTRNIGEGFFIYHTGSTVINSDAVIGKNCHINGNVCIGNGGETNLSVPIIGNNVNIGVGAKIIGGVFLADNCIVGAGAVVTKSCLIPGSVLAGVPAVTIKKQS